MSSLKVLEDLEMAIEEGKEKRRFTDKFLQKGDDGFYYFSLTVLLRFPTEKLEGMNLDQIERMLTEGAKIRMFDSITAFMGEIKRYGQRRKRV